MKPRLIAAVLLLSPLAVASAASPAAAAAPDSAAQARIARVENGLLPPVLVKGESGWSILERMRHYDTPGVSIAVIDGFAVAWARGYGVKDAATREPVVASTLFQAASISKSLNATAILRRVQDGRLSLDADVNDYLRSWRLPDNAYTATAPVTLAHLLSHTGGTTVGSFSGYPAGAPLPTIQRILSGSAPANSPPVVVDAAPGLAFRYSGGGTLIAQLVLMDLERKPYPQIMEEMVLGPLQMTNSTFAQPLPAALRDRAATAHRDGVAVDGRFFVYPELAAAGLWSTPTDLAKFAIEHQLSALGKSNRILSVGMEEKMLTPCIGDEYGLGFGLFGGAGGSYFEHSGGNRGFSSLLFAHKTKGYGAVIMANSDAHDLVLEILRAIAAEYHWEDYLPAPFEIVAVSGDALLRVQGRYLINDDNVLSLTLAEGRLLAARAGSVPAEILPVSDREFISRTEPSRIALCRGAAADPDTMRLTLGGRTLVAIRIGDDRVVPYEHLMAGRVDTAIALYREMQRSDSTNALIAHDRFCGLAERLWSQNRRREAIALLSVNAELHPQSAEAFSELAGGYAAAGERELAIQSYERALALRPDDPTAAAALQKLKAGK
jgi:CubicO group peptidase (beta-lactamase class C family)